jgi:hypothetical protein
MSINETNVNQAVSMAHAVAGLAQNVGLLSSSAVTKLSVEGLISRLSAVATGLLAVPITAATADVSPIPAPIGDEVIVNIETAPGLTVEKLEDLSTLEAYFVRAAASGVIDFTVRCTHHQEGEGAHFYIHPANISGETLQFVVAENTLRNV